MMPGWLWPPWWPGGNAHLEKDDYRAMAVSLASAASGGAFNDDTYKIAEASLKSVIDLTGYEDNKIARLLTVAAFLSAIIGAVFTRFSTSYSWAEGSTEVRAAYVVFFVYATLVSLAATVLIGSIRPTFNLKWTNESGNAPRSLFFYREILGVSPEVWANEFRLK